MGNGTEVNTMTNFELLSYAQKNGINMDVPLNELKNKICASILEFANKAKEAASEKLERYSNLKAQNSIFRTAENNAKNEFKALQYRSNNGQPVSGLGLAKIKYYETKKEATNCEINVEVALSSAQNANAYAGKINASAALANLVC
jgi:hypothetical protein